MKFFKKILAMCLLISASVWAGESNIRNVCDSLILSQVPKVTLKAAYIDETRWYGDKTLKNADSSKVTRYTDYSKLTPLYNNFESMLPYSLTAECRETSGNNYTYGAWSKNSKSWSLNDGNNNYSTHIMDIHTFKMAGYDSTNTYNILIMKNGSLPSDGSYASGEILVSKSFELQFDWWYASVGYRLAYRDTVITGTDTAITEHGSNRFGYSLGMDSATVVESALQSLTFPDTLKKVSLQVFHVVLMDERKISENVPTTNSSSSVASSSSAEEAASSSATIANSSDSEGKEPGATENSSSSEGETAIAEMKSSPRILNTKRQVRRLDGSFVSEKEELVPGVYYVKGANGLWKKQMVLPR